MPTVLTEHGFAFFFYSNEHLPIHIHVRKAEAKARIVLEPTIFLDKNEGFKPAEIRRILEIVVEQYEFLIDKWHETFD